MSLFIDTLKGGMGRMARRAALAAFVLTCLGGIGRGEDLRATGEPSRSATICRVGEPANAALIDTAVAELTLHLERFFGMRTTIVDGMADRAEGSLRFVVGAGPEGSAPVKEKGRFAIAIRGDDIWLWGHDREISSRKRPGQWDARNSQKGTLQAVYQFLYEFGGVRWLMPGDDNTVRKTAGVPLKLPPTFDKVYSFRFARSHMDYMAHDGNHLWRNMGRLNVGVSHSFIHNWGQLIGYNRHFKEHPEYYALVKGERKPYPGPIPTPEGEHPSSKGTQVCTSNPEVAEIFARRIVEIYRRTGQDIIEVSPNDGGGFCECAECKALDRPDLYTPAEIADLGGPCLSDRVFTFLNAVARKVKAAEPKARLGTHLYSYYAMPPKGVERIEDNIIGDFCVEPAYFNDRDYREVTYARIRQWMAKGLGGIGFFWYHGSYYWCQTLHVSPHAIAEFIQEIDGIPGALGVKTEAVCDYGPNALDYYVMFALLNDPKRDVDEVIGEFCGLAYGPGGPAMKRFFALAEKTFMARDSDVWKHYAEVARWYDETFFAQADSLLREATAAAVKGNADDARRRIGIMQDALDHTRNVCDFVGSAAGLRAYGLPFDLPHLDPSYQPPFMAGPDEQAARDALIDRVVQYRERMLALAARLDGTAYFNATQMLKADAVGNWGKTLEMLKALRGKKDMVILTGAWPFQVDPQDRGEQLGWHRSEFKPEGWKNLRLDAFWEDQGFGEPAPEGYNGVAWYRILFRAPAHLSGTKVRLRLGAVDESCQVWVNGQKVGEFVYDPIKEPYGWNTPREVEISGAVSFGRENMVAVRVGDKAGKGGIWKGALVTFE